MPTTSLLTACELERARAIRTNRTFAVVLLDVGSSSVAARRAARRLGGRVRTFDTVVLDRRRGRLGVVLPELRAGELDQVSARLRTAIDPRGDLPCAAAMYPSDGATATELLATCEGRLERGHEDAPAASLGTAAR